MRFISWRIFNREQQMSVSEAYWIQLCLKKDKELANIYQCFYVRNFSDAEIEFGELN